MAQPRARIERGAKRAGKEHDVVFRSVDALYTAVCMKDAAKLAQCEERLKSQHADGALPESAATHLDGVITQARNGDWEGAAHRLYAFMLAQHRDDAGAPTAVKPAKGARTAQRR